MAKMKDKGARNYDTMSPNAGSADSKMKSTAEGHGVGMGLGIGKKTSDAKINDWGDFDYALGQSSNGSMDYDSHKKMVNKSDVKKIRGHMKKESMQSGS